MIVFVDMDGVMANFVKAVCSLYKVDYNSVLKDWIPGEWNISKNMPHAKSDFDIFTDIGFKGVHFWRDIQPYNYTGALWGMVSARFNDAFALTHPTKTVSCFAGKSMWMLYHVDRLDKLILTTRKELLAAPGRLLIDDNDNNCNAWRDHGGISILVPRPWNSAHSLYVDDESTMGYIVSQLEELK